MKQFRLVPQLDRNPWMLEFAQTWPGKIVLLIIFSGGLCLFWPSWTVFISIALAFCLFLPNFRHIILPCAALASVLSGRTGTIMHWEIFPQMFSYMHVSPDLASRELVLFFVAIVLLCCFLLVHFSQAKHRIPLFKRPILLVLSSYLLLLAIASYAPLGNTTKAFCWLFLVLFGNYIWFLCYSLSECNDPQSPPFAKQLGHYLPFWYISPLPIPKGASYIRRIQATSSEALAICQLKGIKLIMWACYLSLFSLLVQLICHSTAHDFTGLLTISYKEETLHFLFRNQEILNLDFWPVFFQLPHYRMAFSRCIAGTPLPIYQSWFAVILQFLMDILHLALITHAVIAICRMAGYNALRNVYRPLQAKTIAGFWNRYYYYFKELLVAVFFYPTFCRYFKKQPALRLYFATFMAAGVGNFLYHFLLEFDEIITQGFLGAIMSMKTYMFYCFMLVNGIFISQWRRLQAGSKHKTLPQPFAMFVVLGFYCLIDVFGDLKSPGITESFKFFFSLFNINIG